MKMKKYIYLLIATALVTLSSCYDNDPIKENMWVSDIKTLPYTEEDNDNYIVLRGETKMESGNLYFLLSQNPEFEDSKSIRADYTYDEKEKEVRINKWEYIGTWYYKLVAQYDRETYDVANTETFTIENPLAMLEPTDVTWSTATLRASSTVSPTNAGKARQAGFIIQGKGINRTIDATHNYKEENGEFIYTKQVDVKLSPTSEYTVYFYQYIEGIRVISEPMIFSTTQRTSTPLKISSISGTMPDANGNNVKITEDLSIVVYDYEEGYATKEPLTAVYNQATNNYEFKEGSSFTLYDGHTYGVAIFKNEGTTWNTDGNRVSFIWYGEGYAEGINQNPIYYGTSEKLTIDNPSIKANLNVRTAQLRIRYPSVWGESKVSIIDSKKSLPSFQYGMEGIEIYGPSNYTSEYLGVSNGLTSDGQYYEYVFNIWPVSLNPNTHSIRIYSPMKTMTIPMQSTVNLKANQTLSINFEGFSIEDVVVTPWETTENGNTIIIKEKR